MAIENVNRASQVEVNVEKVSSEAPSPAPVRSNVTRESSSDGLAAAVAAHSARQSMEGEEKNTKVAKSTVVNTVSHANNVMERTRCEFSYHEATHRVSIKIIDKDTQEVVKEIPPEKSLEMLEKMWEMAGLLVDERR